MELVGARPFFKLTLMPETAGDITRLVRTAAEGDAQCESQLYELVFGELRKIAKARLRNEASSNSVETAELIDDAFRKVVGRAVLENRSHFYRVAARAMRQVIIDRARKRKRRIEKQLNNVAVELDELATQKLTALIALDESLKRFQELDPRAAEIVQLHHFGGCTIQETAEILDISVSTVKNDWNAAKAWLKRDLSDES